MNTSSERRSAAALDSDAGGPRTWIAAQNLLARMPALVRWLRLPAWFGLGIWLLWAGLVHAPGGHDNDWPLLMWLVKHASWSDPTSLALGHYGPAQLLLAWWTYPLFGSTLVAAKVLSTVGVLVCVGSLYSMTRRDHGEGPALLAAAAFGLSSQALETGQSEFADAPATALLLAGLCLWWRNEGRATPLRSLCAGALLGSAGLMRTHFVFFSIGSALLAAALGILLPAEHRRRDAAKMSAALIVGVLLGNLPGFALNWHVHGQLGSKVASTFVGQVLYGFDPYDLPGTYAAHPLSQILRDHPLDIVHLMQARGAEHPVLWLIPIAALVLALWRRRVWPAAVLRHVLLVSAMAFAYFWAFVSLAWVVHPRVTLPIVSLDSWLVVVVLAQLFWTRFRWAPLACSATFVLAIALQWPDLMQALKARWRESRGWWRASTELVRVLRQRGMTDAREAFVFDWNRFVVDDPQFQPFYNFGYWNLLVPDFAAERPNPLPYLGDLESLATFLENHGVRFLVLPRALGPLRRFPALRELVQGQRELPGFPQRVDLREDVVFLPSSPAPSHD